MNTPEHARMQEITDDMTGWRRWGPYVSERAWAGVREDYSADGNAWGFLPHELARSKAYRWGEDGIAGVCDRYQIICFAPAFWNEKDPILKERLFGLTPAEGNHGEDVKEYYFHSDNTPTHSYMRYLYKYPQGEFPYARLVEENRRREGKGFEYELLDTGIFDEDRYFDITIEYAKATPDDLVIRIEAVNRGPEAAPLHILPHLWFRNTWSWSDRPGPRPRITLGPAGADFVRLRTSDCDAEQRGTMPVRYHLGAQTLYAQAGGAALFTENETNAERVFGPQAQSASRFVKDAFHRHVIHGEQCVNPEQVGTKAALHYRFDVPAGGSVVVRLRLSGDGDLRAPLAEVDGIIARRLREADQFYDTLHPEGISEDERRVQRQAWAGLLWVKQSYLFDVAQWLDGDFPATPPPASRQRIRNQHWRHLNSLRVMLVADKWEYPWFAAWDFAFECVALAVVDAAFAKEQLWLLLFEQFQHPNGQIPAYEWEFSDLNAPLHGWAVWRVYNTERLATGKGDRAWLERCFHKLLINLAFWVNKVDRQGNNIFEGGFLGMDNISVMDRSEQYGGGALLEQSDATGWMGMFCLNMMRIALELAGENRVYEGMAVKFFQHYAYVAHAMKNMGGRAYQLWDEEDGFFYDVLRFPDGSFRKFRVRSMVGLIPLFAVERLEMDWIEPFAEFKECLEWFVQHRQDIVEKVMQRVKPAGGPETYILTIFDQDQLPRLFDRFWNADEFLSPYGIRSLSKAHEARPFEFEGRVVAYEAAESDLSKLKGGNSNWRGPIWFPTDFLLIESLRKLGKAFGPGFTLTQPAAGGRPISFDEMAREFADRLIRIFLRDENGRRPFHGGARKFQEDPHWRDHLLFYEYFNGDNGAGLGASHQTGWTALVASLIDEWRRPTPAPGA
jgi:hypothetical protein